MNSNNNTISVFVGLLAGLTAAALLYSSGRGTAISVLLIFASPLPIYLASFAYGTTAAISAAITTLVLVAIAGSTQSVMVVGLILILPAALLGHQANLAQPTEDGTGMDWFPLERLFTNLLMYLAVGFIVVGFITGYNPDTFITGNFETFKQVLATMPNQVPLSDDELKGFLNFIFNLFPFLIPGMFVMVHIANAAVAERLTHASGRMARPQTDIANEASLPPMLVLPALGALVCVFIFQPPLSHIFSVIAGTLLAGFSMIGLASAHLKARNSTAGSFLLFVTYFLILAFSFVPIFFLSGLGMMRMWSRNQSTQTPT